MECPECQERTPDGSATCLRCGAELDVPAEESAGMTFWVGLLLILGVIFLAGAGWVVMNSGETTATIGAENTTMDVKCVPMEDTAAAQELEREGWIPSTGGFVSDEDGGKKCFKKVR